MNQKILFTAFASLLLAAQPGFAQDESHLHCQLSTRPALDQDLRPLITLEGDIKSGYTRIDGREGDVELVASYNRDFNLTIEVYRGDQRLLLLKGGVEEGESSYDEWVYDTSPVKGPYKTVKHVDLTLPSILGTPGEMQILCRVRARK